eukprot:1747680-Amphidinium_carterae.2
MGDPTTVTLLRKGGLCNLVLLRHGLLKVIRLTKDQRERDTKTELAAFIAARERRVQPQYVV